MSIECSSCVGAKKEACEKGYRYAALRIAGIVDLVLELSELKGKRPEPPNHDREIFLGSLECMAKQIDCALTEEEIKDKLDLALTMVGPDDRLSH